MEYKRKTKIKTHQTIDSAKRYRKKRDEFLKIGRLTKQISPYNFGK